METVTTLSLHTMSVIGCGAGNAFRRMKLTSEGAKCGWLSALGGIPAVIRRRFLWTCVNTSFADTFASCPRRIFRLNQKLKFAESLYLGIVRLDSSQISSELRDEIAAVMSKSLGQIPFDNCVSCNRPVFKHAALRIDAGYLCDLCKGKKLPVASNQRDFSE
jgi:hypothetical protein